MLLVRRSPVTPDVWMRSGLGQVLGMALTALLLLPDSAPASSGADRPLTIAISGGYRIFNHQLGLQDDAAFGVRLGLGLSPRAEIALDYVLSDPLRGASHKPATVSALRALARFEALDGPTRPYAIAGLGGVLIDFNDAPDYSTGALTAGLGVAHDLSSRLVLRLEATTDIYHAEVVTYDPGGAVLSRSRRLTDALATLAAGLGVRF